MPSECAEYMLSNIQVVPIQVFVLVTVQAIVRGAKTLEEVKNAVKAAFLPVYRFSSVSSPLAMLFAQNFLPPRVMGAVLQRCCICPGNDVQCYIEAESRESRG